MRKVGAALLFMVAGAFVLLAWLALDNLWAEYQDSPDSTYITVAAIELAIATGFAALGAWILGRRSPLARACSASAARRAENG